MALSILFSLVPLQASHACKVLVKFPAHLTADAFGEPSSFYVVVVKSKVGDDFEVLIAQSFGGKFTVGTSTRLSLMKGEEAYAVCAHIPVVGATYLMKTTEDIFGLQVSRFHGIYEEDHEKFATYVEDLKAAVAR